MSRTPPARPYPRTISSPDCADPPVRPAGAAHRAGHTRRLVHASSAPAVRVQALADGVDACPTSDPTPRSSPNHLATAQVGDLQAADSEGARQPRSQARRPAPIKTDRRGGDTKLRCRCPTRREATEEAAGHEGGLRHQPRDATALRDLPTHPMRRTSMPSRAGADHSSRRTRAAATSSMASRRHSSGISYSAASGFLAEGSLPGHELRRRVSQLTGYTRPVSDGSLYPAINRLAKADLLERRADPGAGPARFVLSLTDAGRTELLNRLRKPADHEITDFTASSPSWRSSPTCPPYPNSTRCRADGWSSWRSRRVSSTPVTGRCEPRRSRTPTAAALSYPRIVFSDGLVDGQLVLVHGVLGGVGSLAAQLARWGGATVIGTVLPRADAKRWARAR